MIQITITSIYRLNTSIKFFLHIILIFLLFSCGKEKGKEKYSLEFKFSSQEACIIECFILEKNTKNGKPVTVDLRRRKKINQIFLQSQIYPEPEKLMSLSIFKSDTDSLIGINYLKFPVNNASFANNQNIDLDCTMQMSGHYYRSGKKFTVNEGKFSLTWNNAPDYGQSVQELTGTWTLKRK